MKRFFIFLINIIFWGLMFQSNAFSQEPTPPDIPTLISPINDVLEPTLSVKLQWNEASNATDYEVQVATSTSSTPFIDQWSDGINYFETPTLNNGTTYYWRVKSYNDNTELFSDDYSDWGEFYISAPPSITSFDQCDEPAGWGAIVKIKGENFGGSQGNGSVYFYSGNNDPNISTDAVTGFGICVSATILPSGWNDNEIDCYIPTYASSGPVCITNNIGVNRTSNSSIVYDIPWGYLGTKWSTNTVSYNINQINSTNYVGSTSAANVASLTGLITAASGTWCSSQTYARFNFQNDQTSSYNVGFVTTLPTTETAITKQTSYFVGVENFQPQQKT